MKKIKIFSVFLLVFSISGCGCYETKAEAWQACDAKYNGKCRYLGDNYKVCNN